MIKDKRDKLEKYIIQQTLGPGINGYRFINISNKELVRHKLDKLDSSKYSNEILDTPPASVYSTGILFPIDESQREVEDEYNVIPGHRPENEVVSEDDGENNVTTEKSDHDIDEPDTVRLDQMYPNTMGITCCLDSKVLSHKKLKFEVRARYYERVDSKSSSFFEDYGILCECDIDSLKTFITTSQFDDKFSICEIDENNILKINNISKDDVIICRQKIKNIVEHTVKELKEELKEFDFAKRTNYLSSIKSACFFEIKKKEITRKNIELLYNVTQKIENLENIISHLDDLLKLLNPKYDLWECKSVTEVVEYPQKLPDSIQGKFICSFKNNESLRDVITFRLKNGHKASLSINLQLSVDKRRTSGNIYFRIQLVNTSTPFSVKAGNNRYYSSFNNEVNEKTFFGVKLSIKNTFLVPYNIIDFKSSKENELNEDTLTQFIYRKYNDYGIGHGCSIDWNRSRDGNTLVESEYLPVCDTPDIEPIPRNKSKVIKVNDHYEPMPYLTSNKDIGFKWLSTFSDATDSEIIEGLRHFINVYNDWIKDKENIYKGDEKQISEIAFNSLKECRSDYNRMIYNIDSFLAGEENSDKLKSFRLMNSVMFMQLLHSEKSKTGKISKIIEDDNFEGFVENLYKKESANIFKENEPAAWRPFQLAFIILNLDGIFQNANDHNWFHRNDLVDLVWFPTGGGKTEAYLGLIALAIINRRLLHGVNGGGTTVLMRYTLRLLTLQQFQRATLLIMALELVRRWDTYNLGDEPISIGMWVGKSSIPNSFNDLKDEFESFNAGKASAIPFDLCPWCNSPLNADTTQVIDSNVYYNKRLLMKCTNNSCSFWYDRPARAKKEQGPLPISLCDEEIYLHPPALLFGTVDKFAQLAHIVSNSNGKQHRDSRRIFGTGNWEDGKPQDGYLPPDLIIQDELHLLLGPLGSSVALFESAIEQLSTHKNGIRPKVISSTATTRNTELQVMALFNREVNLFPKPGVECDDSFFSFYSRIYGDSDGKDEIVQSKRRYIGIFPTGRTQIWMQMRLIAIILTHRAIFELEKLGKENTPLDFGSYDQFINEMDYYHSIISYFNSLKEVGKTESQIHTYIIKEIRRVFSRSLRPQKLMHSLYTYSIDSGELTGRLSGEEVKNELKKVSTEWSPKVRFGKDEKKYINPPDLIVATNMISVGIDVSRFNLMIMNSMPRNIAEYIQASSRVARKDAGLVLTIHHPFRARDISHYEKFKEFHEKIYSYVEPISITPFTKSALDRYLGLYLATLLRHKTRFVDRNSAKDISHLQKHQISKLIEKLVIYFEKRKSFLNKSRVNELVKNLLRDNDIEAIHKWVEEAILDWEEYNDEVQANDSTLVFSRKSPNSKITQEELYVDIDEYEENIHSPKWKIPMSLRVIEPEAALKIELK